MNKINILISLSLLMAGCYSVPFEKPEMIPLDAGISPGAVASRFQAKLPPQFDTENTLVFRILLEKIAALGYAKVNRTDRTFEVLCLNHLGVQLFHISGDAHGNHLRYAMPEFKKHPEFVDAVGQDIRYIYFDLIPGDQARAEKQKDRIIYRQTGADAVTEYIFGGSHLGLLKKKIFVHNDLVRKVSYYEYQSQNDYMYPRGIVLLNPDLHYRLILKTRAFESINEP